MQPIRSDHPLRTHLAGMVENTFFSEVGLCEPRLTDYVSDLMISFLHMDRLTMIGRVHGKRPEQIAALLEMLCGDEAPRSPEQRHGLMYRYIGDYSLFWSGLYPESLRRRRTSPDDLLFSYVAQGKHSYAAAARLSDEDSRPPASLLQSLSDEFETCVHGLGLVRKCWVRAARDAGEPGPGDIVY